MHQDATWYGGRPQLRRHFVRWGPNSGTPPPLKGHSPQFSANARCGQMAGWIKMPLDMEVGIGPGCVRWEPSYPQEKTPTHTQFLGHVYCGHTAGRMTTPLATEVDLGPGHTVLNGVPALRERGTAPTLFSVHVYCGHGRPSQLLLSSCYNTQETQTQKMMDQNFEIRIL